MKAIVGPWNHDHPAHVRPRAAHRLAPRSAALVGPLAEGRATRRRGGAEAGRLRPRLAPAGPRAPRGPGRVAARGRLAAEASASDPLHLRRTAPSGGHASGRRAPPALRACPRAWPAGSGGASRSPTSGRPTPSASSTTRRPWTRTSRSWACPARRCARPRTRRWRTGSCGSPTSRRTAGHAGDGRRAKRRAPERAEPAAARPRPGGGHRRRDALHVVGVPEGPSDPPGRLQRALADDLAHALRDDHVVARRRGHADPASGPAFRRTAPACFPASRSDPGAAPATAP